MTTQTTEEQFWTQVDMRGQDECWIWKNGRSHGYGCVRWYGRHAQAHRLAWELTNGAIPEGMCVCHHCDNPPCCNPAHLFVGTIRDNNMDAMDKGRMNNEEQRRKHSEALKGKPLSAEHRQKIIETKRRIGYPEALRRKMSEAQKGKVLSEEHKRKISEAHQGQPLSEETKRKIGMASRGNQYALGMHHSEESKRKMSEAGRGKPKSEEHRRKMSEAQKQRWVAKKAATNPNLQADKP